MEKFPTYRQLWIYVWSYAMRQKNKLYLLKYIARTKYIQQKLDSSAKNVSEN